MCVESPALRKENSLDFENLPDFQIGCWVEPKQKATMSAF